MPLAKFRIDVRGEEGGEEFAPAIAGGSRKASRARSLKLEWKGGIFAKFLTKTIKRRKQRVDVAAPASATDATQRDAVQRRAMIFLRAHSCARLAICREMDVNRYRGLSARNIETW